MSEQQHNDTIIDFFGDTQGMDKLPTEQDMDHPSLQTLSRVMAEATVAQRKRIREVAATARKHPDKKQRAQMVIQVLNECKMETDKDYRICHIAQDGGNNNNIGTDANSIKAKLRTCTPDQRTRIRHALAHNNNPQVDMIDILYENEGGLRRFVELYGFNNSDLARQIRARLNMHA